MSPPIRPEVGDPQALPAGLAANPTDPTTHQTAGTRASDAAPVRAVEATDRDMWPRAWAVIAVAGAWACFLPLGSKYATFLAAAALGLAYVVHGRQGLTWWRDRTGRSILLLWIWLLVSTAWTSAPARDALSHLFHYGRLLAIPLIALACPPAVARQALGHFAAASAVVGGLVVLDRLHLVPASQWWQSTLTAEGNQRIATSLLMALGAALSLALAATPGRPARQRAAWVLAAVVATLGISLQDRRTGMVALPILLLVLALVLQRQVWRRVLLLGALVLAGGLSWQASSTVRARFDEGWREIASYRSEGVVATSWGMRLRMVQLTADMVRERPIVGHGVGSWQHEWHGRSAGGGELLEAQVTPHNEHLLIAAQGGLVALALWWALLVRASRSALRAGIAGLPALLVWVTVAWTGLFNVVIRDAKFAVPLLLLTGLAMAAARSAAMPLSRPQASSDTTCASTDRNR